MVRNKDFIENYNEDSDERYFLEADVQFPEKLHGLHNDSAFLPERMKIEKVVKLEVVKLTCMINKNI